MCVFDETSLFGSEITQCLTEADATLTIIIIPRNLSSPGTVVEPGVVVDAGGNGVVDAGGNGVVETSEKDPHHHYHHQLNVHFLPKLIKGMNGCFPIAFGRQSILAIFWDLSFQFLIPIK